MAEYFREILFIRGRPDAKIHVKRSVIGQEQLTPSYNQQVIDGILQQFFFNEESFEEDEDPELNDEGRDSGSIVEDSSDEEQPET